MLKKSITFAVAALSALTSYADTVIKAEPVKAGAVKLDGVLNEAVWQRAARHSNFKKFTFKDVPAGEQTVFQVAASTEGVYFAFDIADKVFWVSQATRTHLNATVQLFNDYKERHYPNCFYPHNNLNRYRLVLPTSDPS